MSKSRWNVIQDELKDIASEAKANTAVADPGVSKQNSQNQVKRVLFLLSIGQESPTGTLGAGFLFQLLTDYSAREGIKITVAGDNTTDLLIKLYSTLSIDELHQLENVFNLLPNSKPEEQYTAVTLLSLCQLVIGIKQGEAIKGVKEEAKEDAKEEAKEDVKEEAKEEAKGGAKEEVKKEAKRGGKRVKPAPADATPLIDYLKRNHVSLPLAAYQHKFYADNHLLRENFAEAVKDYEEALELGLPIHPEIFYKIGLYYERGMGGLLRDEKEAAKWFVRAANMGHAEANYTLGFYYEAGRGGLDDDKTLCAASDRDNRRSANSAISFALAAEHRARGFTDLKLEPIEHAHRGALFHIRDSWSELEGKASGPEEKIFPRTMLLTESDEQKEKENYLLNLRARLISESWKLKWGGGKAIRDNIHTDSKKVPAQVRHIVLEIDRVLLSGSFIDAMTADGLFNNIFALLNEAAKEDFNPSFFRKRSKKTNSKYMEFRDEMKSLKKRLQLHRTANLIESFTSHLRDKNQVLLKFALTECQKVEKDSPVTLTREDRIKKLRQQLELNFDFRKFSSEERQRFVAGVLAWHPPVEEANKNHTLSVKELTQKNVGDYTNCELFKEALQGLLSIKFPQDFPEKSRSLSLGPA